ncbi:Hachiman antiphage defense system protein HamA [Pseudomonas syringae]|uniref:Hachiman antiphage defense system protein HamA n=1 Tax=Pseudomonas syringae TaxID=317 RepID=UPI003F842643
METETAVSTHKLHRLNAESPKIAHAVTLVAEAVPSFYVIPSRLSGLLAKLGKPAAADYIATKLPVTKAIRSGDLGEILCNAYVLESTKFNLGIRRLRWKDHREMSMRGEDVLAFSLDPKAGLHILKAEVKSRASMTSAVISEARDALSYNNELPSPHAISFVADRLNEASDVVLRDALDKAQLIGGIKQSQITHMLFTFSGSNPSNLLTKNLNGYSGSVPQQYVALTVSEHQDFIKSVFETVVK